MASAIEYVEYFYPHLRDEADPRYVPLADLDTALAVAADYRPTCLPEDRQNQAQAHRAAYEVEFRRQVAAANASAAATEVTAGPLIEKTEGDVTLRWATTGGTTTTAQIKANLTGPGTPYAKWQELNEICTPAVTESTAPPRRGGIITRFGLPS